MLHRILTSIGRREGEVGEGGEEGERRTGGGDKMRKQQRENDGGDRRERERRIINTVKLRDGGRGIQMGYMYLTVSVSQLIT